MSYYDPLSQIYQSTRFQIQRTIQGLQQKLHRRRQLDLVVQRDILQEQAMLIGHQKKMQLQLIGRKQLAERGFWNAQKQLRRYDPGQEMPKRSQSTQQTQVRQLDYIHSIRALQEQRDLLREQLQLQRLTGESNTYPRDYYPLDDSAQDIARKYIDGTRADQFIQELEHSRNLRAHTYLYPNSFQNLREMQARKRSQSSYVLPQSSDTRMNKYHESIHGKASDNSHPNGRPRHGSYQKKQLDRSPDRSYQSPNSHQYHNRQNEEPQGKSHMRPQHYGHSNGKGMYDDENGGKPYQDRIGEQRMRDLRNPTADGRNLAEIDKKNKLPSAHIQPDQPQRQYSSVKIYPGLGLGGRGPKYQTHNKGPAQGQNQLASRNTKQNKSNHPDKRTNKFQPDINSYDQRGDPIIVHSPIKRMQNSSRISQNDGKERSAEKASVLRPVFEKQFSASKSKSIRDSRRSNKYDKLQDIPHDLNITERRCAKCSRQHRNQPQRSNELINSNAKQSDFNSRPKTRANSKLKANKKPLDSPATQTIENRVKKDIHKRNKKVAQINSAYLNSDNKDMTQFYAALYQGQQKLRRQIKMKINSVPEVQRKHPLKSNT